MGHFGHNPHGDLDECGVAEVEEDLDVGFDEHGEEGGVELHHFEQGLEEVVDGCLADELFELVEDLVHAAQKDLLVVGETLDQIDAIFYQLLLLG